MSAQHLIVIGASAGGVEALLTLARELRSGLPAAICIVLHQPRNAPSVLPGLMTRAGELQVVHAESGVVPQAGGVYLAPPNQHLLIEDGRFRLDHGPLENGHRPAIDPLFRSAAAAYGPAVTAVVLSGSLDDGAAGCVAVKRHGGSVLVQDPDEALYPDMPRAAMHAAGPVDGVLTLRELVEEFDRLRVADPSPPGGPAERVTNPTVQGGTDPRSPTEGDARGRDAPVDAAVDAPVDAHDPLDPEGRADLQPDPEDPVYRQSLSCPSCGGSLHQERAEDGRSLRADRWRCRVGHGWSLDSLFAQQGDAAEVALWAAVRVLEERSALCRRLGERARGRGQARAVQSFDRQAREAEHHARSIRESIHELVHLLGTSGPTEGLAVPR